MARVHSTGSPQKGREVLGKAYTVRREEAKRKYEKEFRELEQKSEEGVMTYLS